MVLHQGRLLRLLQFLGVRPALGYPIRLIVVVLDLRMLNRERQSGIVVKHKLASYRGVFLIFRHVHDIHHPAFLRVVGVHVTHHTRGSITELDDISDMVHRSLGKRQWYSSHYSHQ